MITRFSQGMPVRQASRRTHSAVAPQFGMKKPDLLDKAAQAADKVAPKTAAAMQKKFVKANGGPEKAAATAMGAALALDLLGGMGLFTTVATALGAGVGAQIVADKYQQKHDDKEVEEGRPRPSRPITETYEGLD